MRSLKRNSILSIFIFLNACTTSSYRVINSDSGKVELGVTPERVLCECKEVPTDNGIFYWFFLRVLDDENTVLTLMQSNLWEKEYCQKLYEKVQKILKRGKHIYIGGFGDMEKDSKFEHDVHRFPNVGTFKDNGQFLQFGVIANERNDCYQAYREGKPCPAAEFPIKK